MASAASLPASVAALTLQSTDQKSKFAGCFPTLNPMDIYREHIAEQLGNATGIDAAKIYARLAWTSTLDKGDLSLPVCAQKALCRMSTVDWN
jgi:arginyl-tRNA synthetase